MRWFVLLFVIAVTVTASVNVARVNRTDLQSAPIRAAAQADATAAGDVSRIFAGGIVEGTHREMPLRFEVPGRIKSVRVHEGDLVRAGDILAELDTEITEVRLAEARTQAKIALAERDLIFVRSSRLSRDLALAKLPIVEQQIREADSVLERRDDASGQESLSRKDHDQVRQRLNRAAAQLQSLRTQVKEPSTQLTKEEEEIADCKVALSDAAVRREQLLLDKASLRAPVTGVILRVLPQPGELVGPGDERELFLIANRDHTCVRAFVEELDALHVAPGRRAVVTASGHADREYRGVVRSCAPHVGPKSHRHLKPGERLDVRVRDVVIELEGGSDLVIGLPVEVFIEAGSP